MLFIHPSQLLIYLVMMMSLSWPCGPPPEATESQHQKTYYLLHLYSLTRSEMIKSTEHNWWKFSRAMRYIITDISSCYHHPHSPAIRASSLLHLLSCQFFLLVLPNWLIIMNHGCSHPSVIQWRYRKVQHYLVLFFPISIMSIMAFLAAARFLDIFH